MRYNCQNNFSYARSIHSHQRGNLLFFARTTFFACTKMNATRAPIREVTRKKIVPLYRDFRDYFGDFFSIAKIFVRANSWNFVGKYYFYRLDGDFFCDYVHSGLSCISRRKSGKSDFHE